ncbi:MAG: PQQ-binding-like beta-propeller repeat protein [Dehalococcoidia bacterium]|nr:PQQ-binding-like beta-propeller repeat protein [Dehalococcoidia bacterium]
MAHDVFISYAAEDRTAANAVCARLEANRIRCWIAPRDVLPSVRWADAIVEAINESRIMVLVFTSHSNNSDQVMSEVEAAVNKGIPILPLKIEDVPLTSFMQFHIAKRHWLDALTPPLERHLQYLAETVQVLLARIGEQDQVAEEAGAPEVAGTAEPLIEKGTHTPAPARKAPELGIVRRWGSQRVVWLVGVLGIAVVVVVAAMFLLLGWPFGGGDGGATPTETTTAGGLEVGTWSGTTSQGRNVEFDVIESGRAMGRIKFDVEGECPLPAGGAGPQPVGCTCEVKQETKMTKPWPIADKGFSYAPGDYEFSAVFDSTRTASGFVRVHTSGTGAQAPCSSDQVTWTASLEQAAPASPSAAASPLGPTASPTPISTPTVSVSTSVPATPAPTPGLVQSTATPSSLAEPTEEPTAAPISTPTTDARSPKVLWRSETWTPGAHTSPAVADGVVYFAAHDQNVYALDAATGEERWRFQTGGLMYSSPAVVGGVLYIGSNDSYVYALDAASGAEHWRFQTGSYVFSSPTVGDGVVYIGSDDEYVYALDAATGEKRWRFKTDGEIDSAPAVVDGVVYVTGCDGIHALDTATGQERWHVGELNCISSSPAVVGGTVYIAPSLTVLALDAATGEERWLFTEYLGGDSDPAVADGVVYIGDREGYVYALDASTGEQLWRVETGEWVEAGLGTWRFEPSAEGLSSPAVSDGVVYIGSDDNSLYALEAATGEQLWRFETGFWVRSRPAVVDGVIYLGSVDGYVYALDATRGE